ncbi:MAG TPA: helix-turn-helix transcriptional regulator [Verrucomicrobiae bacterium]|nr:helix-turn-helix transcriptional regulator [Verrucomicrobiae bacterium]
MPRKNQLPESEKAIGKRLSAIRGFHHLTQPDLAKIADCTEGLIANIESGRAPLRAEVGMKICRKLKVNPQWLATSNGSPHLTGDFSHHGLDATPQSRMLFSLFFGKFLAPKFEQMIQDVAKSVNTLEEFVSQLPQLPRTRDNRKRVSALAAKSEKLLAEISQDLNEREYMRSLLESAPLTNVHVSANTPRVKAQWPILKRRLQVATSEIDGGKTRLAEFLGVKLASVSQWLTDNKNAREPGAETTLQMLRWVELQERK